MPQPFSSVQCKILKYYADGDFSHIQTEEELENCGDGLLKFLMLELSAEEDCEDEEEAYRRLNTVIKQLEEVRELF